MTPRERAVNATPIGTVAALIAALEKAIAEILPEEGPGLLGDLERLKVVIWARMMVSSSNHHRKPANEIEADQLLTPQEAARILGVTPRWLYRHAKRLPFTKRISRKVLRFSEVGLRRWLAAKKT